LMYYGYADDRVRYSWFMLFRDVIDPPVSVPDGGIIAITERVLL